MQCTSRRDGSAKNGGSAKERVLDAYQAVLRQSGSMDFEDMILMATQALRQSHVHVPLAEHLLLDEVGQPPTARGLVAARPL